MIVPLVATTISFKVGAALISKGCEIALPEIAKLVNAPELKDLTNKVTEESILASTLGIIPTINVQSK